MVGLGSAIGQSPFADRGIGFYACRGGKCEGPLMARMRHCRRASGCLRSREERTYRRGNAKAEFDPKRKFGLIDSFKLRQYNLFRRVFERQAVKQR